jgi:hypothetical protein
MASKWMDSCSGMVWPGRGIKRPTGKEFRVPVIGWIKKWVTDPRQDRKVSGSRQAKGSELKERDSKKKRWIDLGL